METISTHRYIKNINTQLNIAEIHVFYKAFKNGYDTQNQIQVIVFKISGFLIENYIYSKIRTIWYISNKLTNLPFALENFDFWSDLTVANSHIENHLLKRKYVL